MAVLEQQIQATLAALAPAGGVYQDINTSEPPAYPYIVWTIVSSPINNTLAGPSALQNTRLQVDVYSLTAAERRTLSASAVTALLAGPFDSVLQLDDQNLYEEAIRAFRRTSDFSIWSPN